MITILIPTHNRPSYLARCLSFLRNSRTTHRIILADSSEDNAFYLNKQAVDIFAGLSDIRQIDCRGMGLGDKYLHALLGIDTPFVAVCGDDDFIVPSTLTECTAFLQENNDYSHAHGRIITFFESRSATNPIKSLRNYPQIANEAEPYERLITHFTNYANNFYSVHRTDLFHHNFQIAAELDIGRGLKERLIAALDIINGKRKMFDGLFIMRQKGLTGTDENGRRTFDDNPTDINYFGQISFGYDDYLAFLRKILESRLSLSQSQAQNILDYVDQDYSRWKATRTRQPGTQMLDHRMAKLPRQAYRNFKDLMITARTRSELSMDDRKMLNIATAVLRKFYASYSQTR